MLNKLLLKLDACEDARAWAKDKTLDEAWDTCQRGEWMIWLLVNAMNKVTDRELRLIAVACARQVQHLMTDQRSIDALNVAERYANGEATRDDLAAAGDAARAAAGAAAWAAAGDAAWAAAGAAAWAAAGAAGAAARAAARAKQADIVRSFVPKIELCD